MAALLLAGKAIGVLGASAASRAPGTTSATP
jgi:hypothetical protein